MAELMQSEKLDEHVQDCKVLACVALYFRFERLYFFARQVRSFAQLGAAKLDLVVITQTNDHADISKIRSLVAPFENDAFVVHIVSVPQGEARLGPYYLTWEHKLYLKYWFMDSQRGYTHFIYTEDDMLFTNENFRYFLKYRIKLNEKNVIPFFLRIEFNLKEMKWVYTDRSEIYDLNIRAYCDSDGFRFTNLISPYAAVLVLDRKLAAEHVEAPSFDFDASRTYGWFGDPERANMGLAFDGVDYGAGFFSRYVIPVNFESGLPFQGCMIEHMAGNFTNGPDTIYRTGRLPIDQGFTKPVR